MKASKMETKASPDVRITIRISSLKVNHRQIEGDGFYIEFFAATPETSGFLPLIGGKQTRKKGGILPMCTQLPIKHST